MIVEDTASIDAAERLVPQWLRLWESDPSATPFQSPQWLIPWWRHIGEGDLWILAIRPHRDAGDLVGLVPLYIHEEPGSGHRRIFLLGTGTTDYLDGLFAPGWGRRAAEAALAHLARCESRWDVCEFRQLRPGSPLLRSAAPAPWSASTQEGEPCPVLTLPQRAEELDRHVPSRLLNNLRYYQRRAERIAPLRIERADRGNLQTLFGALLDLHRARWSSRQLPGVLADPAVQACHRESLPGLLELGVLRICALRLGERIMAVYYGLADARKPSQRAYYYLSGFDPEWERLSPGTLVIGCAVEQAVREGAAAFDFLRGREPYKYLWGAKDTPVYQRRLRGTGHREPVSQHCEYGSDFAR